MDKCYILVDSIYLFIYLLFHAVYKNSSFFTMPEGIMVIGNRGLLEASTTYGRNAKMNTSRREVRKLAGSGFEIIVVRDS